MNLLDLVVQYDCNLGCTYCTITPEMRARQALSLEFVAGEIARGASLGCTEVQFTGGEPTAWPHLMKAVKFASLRGYTDVKVQSNGLLFAHAGNLDRLLRAGANRIAVSVHGWTPDDDRYQATTQGPDGAAETLLQAIGNLVASGVALEVDLIVMRSSLAGLPAAVEALHGAGVQAFKLWFVSLTDNNVANVESMPTLTEALPAVNACLDYGTANGVDVRSLHIPRCLLPGREAQVDHPGVGVEVRVVTPDAVFDLTASRLSGGHKPERCSTCRYDAVCPGLRADYVARFGDDEVTPVL